MDAKRTTMIPGYTAAAKLAGMTFVADLPSVSVVVRFAVQNGEENQVLVLERAGRASIAPAYASQRTAGRASALDGSARTVRPRKSGLAK